MSLFEKPSFFSVLFADVPSRFVTLLTKYSGSSPIVSVNSILWMWIGSVEMMSVIFGFVCLFFFFLGSI